MKPQAIILAGGLGTRLSGTVPGLPKCMAPVAGRPFLFYVINYLRSQGVDDFIFSLGFKHEVIEEYLADYFSNLKYSCTVEQEPLGTGGAIQLACRQAESENLIIANGDTVFKVAMDELIKAHTGKQADCTLALKPMLNFDRYGAVQIDEKGMVSSFSEKKFYASGLVDGGLYILNRNKFLSLGFPEKFSFESAFLEKQSARIAGYVEDAYFIDIGVPQDYFQAQKDFEQPPLDLKSINKEWTLFLDRDGVINHEKDKDYIRNREEFRFYENVPAIFKKLGETFGRIIVITNQRGVGKQLMTEEDLHSIHEQMKGEISKQGGRIDAIYYCTSLDDKDPRRKPNPGMALQAKKDFPDIDFSKSIMVGNTVADMRFGKNSGTYTVFIATTRPQTPFPHPDINYRFENLVDFVKAL